MKRKKTGQGLASHLLHVLFGIRRSPVPLGLHTLLRKGNLVEDDPLLKRYVSLLSDYAPGFDFRLIHGLCNSVQTLKQVDAEILEYQRIQVSQTEALSETRENLRAAQVQQNHQRLMLAHQLIANLGKNRRLSDLWSIILSLLLSLMVFNALLEIWQFELDGLIGEDWLYVLFFLCSAIAINMGVMYTISNKVHFRLARRYASNPEGGAKDLPFWEALHRGDPLLYTAISLVLFEVFFIYPFLLGRLPYHYRDVLFVQCSLFIGVGYLAYLNVLVSWTAGQARFFRGLQTAKVAYEQVLFDLLDREREVNSERRRFERQAVIIQEQIRRIKTANKRSKREYRKLWKQVVRCSQSWERALPYLLEDLRHNGAPSEVIADVSRWNELPIDNR